jgi:predicted nucleic acid-binding protein
MPETKAHFIDINIWLYALLDAGETEKAKGATLFHFGTA